jgi:4-amino-4-deoxy-L-arabinose transferase-like glycosyltransferase
VETSDARRRRAILVTLAVVSVVGLGLRVGYAIDRPYTPPPDAEAYARIAANLQRDGSFDARPEGEGREVQPSSAYSPGLPLLVAGVYELTGGEHAVVVLVLLALIGSAAIPLAFLLGLRLAGPVAGLIGAVAVAAYPALIEYQALLLTEPLAATLLVAALLAFLSASSQAPSPPRSGTAFRWAAAGVLLGLLTLVRPEYLMLALLLPLLWLAREGVLGEWRRGLASTGLCLLATVFVLAPWTVRNLIVLDRFVPLSTGGGKALYIGTNLESDGDSVELREELLSRQPALRARLERAGPVDDPRRMVLERVLARVAAERYPGLETDAALGRLGRENLEHGLTEEPLRFADLMIDKAYATWTDSARETMERQPWRVLQLSIVVLSLIGLVFLALRRRFEALVLGVALAYMTAVAALLISSPRRELVVLPLLATLAGVGATALADSLARRWQR